MTPFHVAHDIMHRTELSDPSEESDDEIIVEIWWLTVQMFRTLEKHFAQTDWRTGHLMTKQTQQF